MGIGVTGLVTYAYFSLASHALDEVDYGGIALLWSSVFFVVSVLYRPVEQLLSRTIAEREAHGQRGLEHLRVAAIIQLALGGVFALATLAARGPIEDGLFNGSETLYWVLVVAVLAYAASYFARGFLAGHRRYGLYGGLVLMEALSRLAFALAVAIGIAAGAWVVALGIAAAPIVSLAIVPFAMRRRLRAQGAQPAGRPATGAARPGDAAATEGRAASAASEAEFTLSRGAGFAAAVLLIMVSEQTLLNAGPLIVKATSGPGGAGAAAAGLVFSVLLIVRAPMQLFQAVQTSILPHLTSLVARGEADPFRRSVNATLAAIAGFAAIVTLIMLALGPWLMRLFFPIGDYARPGLVIIAVAMGVYLAAATLNQAALAGGRATQAAACWVGSAAAFVAFLLIPGFDDRVLQVELGFLLAAVALCGLLFALYRRRTPVAGGP